MLEESVEHEVTQACVVASDIGVHPLFLDRIRMVQQEHKKSEKSIEDRAQDDLISAYCTLNRAVNLLKKNERLLGQDLLNRFLLKCEALNRMLRELVMAPTLQEKEIYAAKDKMRGLLDSIKSIRNDEESR